MKLIVIIITGEFDTKYFIALKTKNLKLEICAGRKNEPLPFWILYYFGSRNLGILQKSKKQGKKRVFPAYC